VAFLHGKGRRRLAVVAGDDERSKRRHDAFCAAARALGLPEVHVIVVPSPTTLRSGRSALGELLQRDGGIDAVFCSSDLLALGVMTEAQARGIAVPAQLGIVGFGDLDFAADLNPALTTVRIDGASIGRQAARFIVDRAEGRSVDPRVVDIGFSIVDRASA
jgi:LacI family gluconate utilization system Gnt-I transcriptional repressor